VQPDVSIHITKYDIMQPRRKPYFFPFSTFRALVVNPLSMCSSKNFYSASSNLLLFRGNSWEIQ